MNPTKTSINKMLAFKKKRANNPLFAIFDIVITIFSYFFAYFITNLIYTQYFRFTKEYVIMLFLIIPTWAILLHTSKLTKIPRTRSNLSIFFNFLNFNSIGFALIFLYKHIFELHLFSHYFIISFTIINLFSLYIFRLVTYRVFKYYPCQRPQYPQCYYICGR